MDSLQGFTNPAPTDDLADAWDIDDDPAMVYLPPNLPAGARCIAAQAAAS